MVMETSLTEADEGAEAISGCSTTPDPPSAGRVCRSSTPSEEKLSYQPTDPLVKHLQPTMLNSSACLLCSTARTRGVGATREPKGFIEIFRRFSS